MSTGGRDKKPGFREILGLKGKKEKDKASSVISGNAARPPSMDLTETFHATHAVAQAPMANAVDTCSEKELVILIERMLDDMNLTEEKKEPIRQMTLEKKKDMLRSHGSHLISSSNYTPEYYISHLKSMDGASGEKSAKMIESLRIALTNNPISWLKDFGEKGLNELLRVLKSCYKHDSKWPKIQQECLKCVQAFMNNTQGLKSVVGSKDALKLIAKSLNPINPAIMTAAIKILGPVCLIPPDGHERVLEAITVSCERENRERFLPIVEGLKGHRNNVPFMVSCMEFMNAIINSPDEVDLRMHLRNEFMRSGLRDILEGLETVEMGDLALQVKIFKEHKDDDSAEFSERYENIRMEMEDMNDCYDLIKSTVNDTHCEPFFLSILQHLLCIRDDPAVKTAYYKLIEECVSQIVLHKSGLDPDFRTSRRFNIDVEPLVGKLVESARIDEHNSEQMKKQLEEAILAKKESDARIEHLEGKVKELESGGATTGSKGSGPPPPPPMLAGILAGGAPPPPPPPMPGGKGGPPPPPPPPMPGGKGGPPPPPPPPGGGPPPPPGMMAMPTIIALPFGMKEKKKYVHNVPMKRANWNKIDPKDLSEKSFWVQVHEDKLASDDILKELSSKFSTKPMTRPSDTSAVDAKPLSKKVKELKILDGKTAQNLSILVSSVKMTPAQMKSYILKCDEQALNESLVQQLLHYLPDADILLQLEAFKDQYDGLAEAEQFAYTMSTIKRLVPRLKSLSFKMRFKEMVQDIKLDVASATVACDEVKTSKKFTKLLEIILLVGNYMNSGTKNAQSIGFDISFLTKLGDTKSHDNKTTLVHFLALMVENSFKEILSFGEELSHVEKAAKVSSDMILKNVKQIEKSVQQLELDLKNSRQQQGPDDKFEEVMTSFLKEAQEEYSVLDKMYKKLESSFKSLAEYFVFDTNKYKLEDFFGDLLKFKNAFQAAYLENVKVREVEEKIRRAKEAKEKSERERQERIANKKALVDINADDDQEGVMDNLLEALKTGAAFRKDKPQRRRARPAGAARQAQLNRSRSRMGLLNSSAPLTDGSMETSGLEDAVLSSNPDTEIVGETELKSRLRKMKKTQVGNGGAHVAATALLEGKSGEDETDQLLQRLNALPKYNDENVKTTF